MIVQLEQLPPMRVGTLAHVGPYRCIPETFDRVERLLARRKGDAPARRKMVAFYHDDPALVHPLALRADAGVVLDEDAVLPRGLTDRRIPAGTYAYASLVGPYMGLGATWAEMVREWLPLFGRRRAPLAPFEVYAPTETASANRVSHSDLYAPVL